ncbi:MAG: SusC/RagA family TonB-linked outer membrane protein [Chitinophagaceae bacterium]|nr:SusC/RagA family TonB-linked outer membrane protein [Chitinophagaceae bacterium]
MSTCKTLLVILLVLCSTALMAQERTITGKVIDASGKQPLAGVSVSVKNSSSSSTQSDDNGNFSLRVPTEKFTLLATSIGYAPIEVEVSPNNKEVIIKLSKNDAELGEVIIVGYSNKKRGELTSAVTVVSSEKLKDVTTNNIGNMLQGKVAGLQVVAASGVPGAAPEIRLRGISSVNASQSPLFVVDGVIGGNYDPNDVESVTVLKDAGATAMYGSQANAGVIIVTTKKAKLGKNRFEAKVTTGFRQADFGNMEMMNSNQLYEYQKELYRDYIPGESDNSYKIDLLKFYAERPLSLRSQDYDWQKTIFSNALMQNYYFSFAGRTEKSNYYTGVSYYNEKGTFMNTGFQRLNLRTNLTNNFAKWISLTNNINISASSGSSYDYMDIYYAYLNMPWDNPYDDAGNPRYVDGNSTFKWWSRDKINPVHTINNSDHPYKGFDVNYDAALNIDITPWLSFTSSNRLAAGYNKSSNFFSPSTAGTYHGSGFLDELSTLNYGIVSNNLLKFNLRYGDHSISGLAGVAYEGSKFEVLGGSGKGLPLGQKVLNVVSNSQLVKGYVNEAYIQSFLSQVNYNYLGKYFLSASFRVDGSSNFPPGNQYANFPSVSAAWIASNEDFFSIKNVVNYLKLRASYGVTGTQDIGASRYLGLYSLSAQYNGAVGAVPLQLPSPDLTWESKHQINIGADISLFNRVNLTLDAYRNVTKNLLLQVSQPLSVGFEQRWQNIGEIVNQGLEIGISSTNIKNRNFEWNTDFNINFNNNKLRDLPSPIIKTGSWAISQIYRNDGNLYEFYMPKWAGVNEQTGAPQWERVIKDGNGNVTGKELTSDYAQASYQEVGSALPKFQGGITNTFRYKNISLSFNAYYLYGNKVFSNNLRFVMNDGADPYFNQIVLPKGYSIWTKPGDKATNPSPQNSANASETSTRYLMDGSFLQLRNITLAYSLPDSYVRRLKMEGITISLSADNVHTFTDFVGQDPQTTITPASFATPGVSDFKYPNNRQFLVNLILRF